MKKIRALFFGTPGLSATILSYLLEAEDIEIIGVVTSPDKTGGRGHGVISSSVAQLAKKYELPLFQPEKIKDEEFLNTVRELKPDICIVVAYGKILPQNLLGIPPMGFLNVHTSLLPKYRGAAPIQHALLSGEKVTGLTVQQMSLGMDEGDILIQEEWKVTPEDTTGSLFERTGQRGGPLLVGAIQGLRDGTIRPKQQNHAEATYTKMIEKKDGELNPKWTLDEAYRAWQGFTPWPGLYTEWNGMRITLLEVEKREKIKEKRDGLFICENQPSIQLADGILIIKKIHPAGKKPMTGEEFARGFMRS